MQNLALSYDSYALANDVAIVGGGVDGIAIGAMLAARGLPVHLPDLATRSWTLSLPGSNQASIYKAGKVSFSVKPDSDSYVRSPDILILSGRGMDYEQSLDSVAEMLRPGQTVFLIDSPIASVFDLSQKIFKLRKRMAVNLIETGSLYESVTVSGGTIKIFGLKDQVSVCGRSVNETRSGISIGSKLFPGLVPASNVLERGLSDGSRFLRAAIRLLIVSEAKSGLVKSTFTAEELAMISALEAEIQALGKIYNVSIPASITIREDFDCSLEHDQQELERIVRDNLVLIADLARIAYHPVPTIEKIIDLSAKALGKNLRQDGRKLADLGLAGLKAQEIIEFVNS
ncbi:MAG: hypothetical protein K2W82_11170 [Candidatus Obscuribacterales bacterium]|nr:hypothetical protein [Candidatus Obscuribacterales bacterium]